jgi:hypothetical protein
VFVPGLQRRQRVIARWLVVSSNSLEAPFSQVGEEHKAAIVIAQTEIFQFIND